LIVLHNCLAALAICFGAFAGLLFTCYGKKDDNFGAGVGLYLLVGLALVCGSSWIALAFWRWPL
jgi:hypothetical protein